MEYYPSTLPISIANYHTPVPQPSTLGNIPYIVPHETSLPPLIKSTCAPMAMLSQPPPPPPPLPPQPPPGPICLEIPTKLLQTLEQPQLNINEEGCITTCSNCHQENTLWKLTIDNCIQKLKDHAELIKFLKNHIQFHPCRGNELPVSISNNISYPQATDLYKSSNLDANANEFTPSQKNRGTKTLHKLEYNNNNNNNNNNNTNNNNNNNTNNNNNNNNNSNSNSNNKAVEAREILSQQVNVSDHGTVESGIDSGIHDSRVSDSGNLENATVESLSKFRMQNNNVRNIHDLSQSTESIQSGNRKKTGKRGKKKENGSKDNLNEHEYSHFSNINQLNNQKSNASVDNNYDYKGSSEWHTSKREYSNEKQNQIDDNGSVHRSNKNIFQAKNSNSPNRKKGQSNGFERRSNGHTVDNNSTHDRMSRNSLQKPFKKHETLFHNDRNQDGYINKFSEHRGSRFGLTSNSVSHHNKHDRKYSDSVIEEIKGDLFTAGEDYSLAHCVAEDFRMGAGIAVQFKKKFGGVGNLLDQRKKVGEVAFLQKGNRYIYYLITKRLSNKKPTIETIQSSIEYLRKLCEEHNVKKLAMPTIGCGLDRLRWDDVKKVLYSQFKQTDIRIQVYRYEEDESPNRESTITKPKPVVRIKETPDPLVDIESNTAFVVYGSLNGDVDKTCNQINTKYPFIKKYVELCKESKLELGDIIPISSNREYVCVFLVKKNSDDNFHFTSLERCIQQFNKFLKKENYSYVGIEMVDENDDFLINDKIITIFRNLLSQIVELWICGKKMN